MNLYLAAEKRASGVLCAAENIGEMLFTLARWVANCMTLRGGYNCGMFNSELQGEWLGQTAEEKKLAELAAYYHDQCEAFDKIVCTGTREGLAAPADSGERISINKHAMALRDQIFNNQVQQLGFSKADWQKAIFRAAPAQNNRRP